jgi:hypothetical protein
MALSQAVLKIAEQNGMQLVCTFDAFREYCEEAERNDIAQYHLYDWTKATIENPEKKAKHLKSFAFYLGNEQVYSKAYASVVEKSLQNLGEAMHLIEITMIDSNPANNPQPPS